MYYDLKLLNDMVANTPLPIAVYIGENLKIELANPSMIRTWGKGEQVIGKNYADILPEIHNQQIYEQALSVLKTGIPFHAKDKRVDLVIQGVMTPHYFNYSFIPLLDIEGKIYGVMNTGADVTELHLAKQQVQNSDEKLRMAIESSGIGYYEIDLATQKIITCANFNSICCSEGEISNEQLILKVHPEDQALREKLLEQALTTGKFYCEVRILNEDRSIKWIKISGKIIRDENGNPHTIIGIIQDIHEQKQFEEELKKQVYESTVELRRSNEDLLHFANIVSHDLKEPVRKIKTFSSLLRNESQTDLNDNGQNYLNKVDQSAERMQGIIEGILTYSTLDKKMQSVESINLDELVEDIKTDLELIIEEKDAILIVSELPDIEGAPILVRQLLYNLIHNALKFSKAEQPPRVIITSTVIKKGDADCLEITIRDNGIGLDPQYAERIFNPFERLHSKDQYEGNGLGLSMCRKIAKRHNGTITASGEQDNGAEFIVTLPLKQPKTTI